MRPFRQDEIARFGARAQDLIRRVAEKVGDGVAAYLSAVREGGLIEAMIEIGAYRRTILEIGTLHGISAIALAQFAENVVSIDVQDWPERKAIMKWLPPETRQRIACVRVDDNDGKLHLVRALNFDFAFVDGGHSEAQVALDFDLVRKCGSVLFHDYPCGNKSECRGVGIVVDGIQEGTVTIIPPFAWWRAARACASCDIMASGADPLLPYPFEEDGKPRLLCEQCAMHVPSEDVWRNIQTREAKSCAS